MVLFIKKQKIYNIIFFIALITAFVSIFKFNGTYSLPVMSVPVTGKIIIIDPGHGTPDSGATGYNGTKEKDINLLVSSRLGNLLEQSGAHVLYTRSSDGTIADNLDDTIRNIKRNDMSKRKNIRDNSGADLFISIHMNIFSDPQFKGAQVFYREDDNNSKALATCIQKNIKKIADSTNMREVKNSKNDIFILNNSKIPSVLVECGFLSNPDEEKKLLTKSYQEKIAYSIYGGIIEFLSNI